jgi:glycerophosphoryl diester phosphodiesterase
LFSGGGYDAPENTISAIKLCKKNGAIGIEVDINYTKDSIPILMHDDTLDRTTNGRGNVTDFTYNELSKLKANKGHRLSEQYENEYIPTLEECILLCQKLNLFLLLDIKGNVNNREEILFSLYFYRYVLFIYFMYSFLLLFSLSFYSFSSPNNYRL